MSTQIDTEWITGRGDWWERVDMSEPRGCWPWKQSCGSHGYGQSWDGTTVVLAHRVAAAIQFWEEQCQ